MSCFLAGVADARIFRNNELFATAKTLVDSSISIGVSTEDIRAGKGAKLYGKYFHTSTFDLKLNDAMFKLEYIAANVGADLKIGGDVFKTIDLKTTDFENKTFDEAQPLVAGENIYIYIRKSTDTDFKTYILGDDKKPINFTPDEDSTYCVEYLYTNDNARKLIVNANFTPDTVSVYLDANLYSGDDKNPSTGTKIGTITIKVPRFLLNGTQEISMSMTGAANTPFEGSALAANAEGCEGEGIYAEIIEIQKGFDWHKVLTGLLIDGGSEALWDAKDISDLSIYGLFGDSTSPKLMDSSEFNFDFYDDKVEQYLGLDKNLYETISLRFLSLKKNSSINMGEAVIKEHEEGSESTLTGKVTHFSLKNKILTCGINDTVIYNAYIDCYNKYVEYSVFSPSVNTVDSYSFPTIKNIVFGNNLKTIKDYAFYSIDQKELIIPNSVQEIGANAFDGSGTGLTTVETIYVKNSSDVAYAKNSPWGCTQATIIWQPTGFKSIYLDGENTLHIIGDGTENAILNSSDISAYSTKAQKAILENVMGIGDFAFSGCTLLASINIPNSVTSIGDYAFQNCTSLKSINIPNSVTSIRQYVFKGCTSLTSINIPDSVTSIKQGAFANCTSLTSVSIPNNVTSIGYDTFNGCTALRSINIPDSVTSIGHGAFEGCTSLTSINIPNSVTSIKQGAFYNCTSLTSINIPNSVTHIGDFAFSSCSSLTSINIPNSVTSIGYGAFKGCRSLDSINIPNSVTSIGSSVFEDCTSLKSINIPNSVTSIRQYVFKGCTSLTSIEIPNSVTSIEAGAFYECTSLTSINIPNSVTSIKNGAFYGCTSLKTINIDKEKDSISGSPWGVDTTVTTINWKEGS